MEIEAGKTYEVECPFVQTTFTEFDADGASEVPTWAPGVDWVMYGDYGEPVADGVGKVLYEVVSVHELPGRYHARVFYIRQWVDPDGKQFGKRNLRIKGIQSFLQMTQLYRFGGYEDGFKLRPLPTEDLKA